MNIKPAIRKITTTTAVCPTFRYPPELNLDYTKLPPASQYSRHVVIPTGRSDWPSKIAMEPNTQAEVYSMYLGRKGKYSDSQFRVMISNSDLKDDQIRIYPGGYLARGDPESIIKRYLMADSKPGQPIEDDVSIMICGHASRDSRCGQIGPILKDAFQKQSRASGIRCNVSLISHIGGHKAAGNVIVALPSGPCLWYGWVHENHVKFILEQTVQNGLMIRDLFRGGIDMHGKYIKL